MILRNIAATLILSVLALGATQSGAHTSSAPAANAAAPAASPSDDAAAIRATALDYIEGWYTGDAARMERALHPELAKRIVTTDSATGKSQLGSMSAMTLVQRTREAIGTKIPKEQQQKDVTVLDVFQNTAVVKVVAASWIDYLEMARWNGRWVIVNVLWELKAKK